MGLNITDLISMGSQAMQVMGKGGNKSSIIGNATKILSEFKKYPQTMEGLKQVLNDYGVTSEQATGALGTLSEKHPDLHKLIESKLPNSLSTIMATLNKEDVSKTIDMGTNTFNQSDRLSKLLQAAKRK